MTLTVRSKVGAPVVSDFTSAFGSPIVLDSAGHAYVLVDADRIVDLKNGVATIAEYGGVPGTTDITDALQDGLDDVAANGGGDLVLPWTPLGYSFDGTVSIPAGTRLSSPGMPSRWGGSRGVKLNYRGSDCALTVAPTAGVAFESFGLDGIWLDGLSSLGGTSGLYWNATASGSEIRGGCFSRCTISNFPQHQILHDGTVWDQEYWRVTAKNPDRASDDIVRIQNGSPSQLTFTQCALSPYTAGTWALNQTTGGAGVIRFIGGAVAPLASGAGANGLSIFGGVDILATHMEGVVGQTGTIGLKFRGSIGSKICPSACQSFGTGIQIGDGTATDARGWCIDGDVHGYNGGGGGDVVITAGGSRLGMILNLGYASGSQTVVDNRMATAREVGKLYRLDGAVANVTGAKGGNVALANLLTVLQSLGLVVDSTT